MYVQTIKKHKVWTFEHFEGKKTHWHVSKNKNSFFTQEWWFKLGLDCHATGLCSTLGLFNPYHIRVRYVDMMVQHAWWIMSKTTNTKYNFALTMEIHVQSSNMWSTLGRCNYSVPLWRGSSQETLHFHTWMTDCTTYYECNTVVPWQLQHKLNKCWKFHKNTFPKDFFFFFWGNENKKNFEMFRNILILEMKISNFQN